MASSLLKNTLMHKAMFALCVDVAKLIFHCQTLTFCNLHLFSNTSVVDCYAPMVSRGVIVDGNVFTYNSYVRFRCHSGYTLNGSASARCAEEWRVAVQCQCTTQLSAWVMKNGFFSLKRTLILVVRTPPLDLTQVGHFWLFSTMKN